MALNDVAGAISNIATDLSNYEYCFDGALLKAGSIISGTVNLAGSLAAFYSLNTLWAGLGSIIGKLVTDIANATRQYKWKFLESLKESNIFYDLMCMVEMQTNFHCQKTEEISIIKKLIREDILKEDTPVLSQETSENEIFWDGFKVQKILLPPIQNWIKLLFSEKMQHQ